MSDRCLARTSLPSLLPLAVALGLLCAGALAQPGGESAAAPAPWSEKLVNPAPAPDDLVLPMPCGGAMAFRPVEIPAEGFLDDRPVELGQSDPERGYKEGRRLSHIAGAFSDPSAAVRRYYIGKYETTRDQYAAVTAGTCPKPTVRGRLPATEVSWFDAVDFARRYTEWLLANAPDTLPKEDREPGFLRLPTEEEWELAARGGLKVDEADFLAPVFPMPEGDLALYAWFESTRSAEGELHPVGLLKPNPLGLHDILGNAAEMTLIPFHLDRRGRPHGQAGGFVARGGDVFTPETQLGSAVRQEHNYFNAATGRAKTADSLGFRLALTAPVIVSSERLDAIKEAWTELPTRTGDPQGDAAQALAELGSLAERTRDDGLRARLELIERDLARGQAAIAEGRARTARALVRMGAFLGKRVITDRQRALAIEQLMGLAQGRFDDFAAGVAGKAGSAAAIDEARASLDEKMAKWRAQVDEIRSAMENSLSYYGDMVVGVGRDYGDDEIRAALAVVGEELTLKQNAYLVPYAERFADHLAAYRSAGRADKDAWMKDLERIEAVAPGARGARS